jgi:hypothetical protein
MSRIFLDVADLYGVLLHFSGVHDRSDRKYAGAFAQRNRAGQNIVQM